MRKIFVHGVHEYDYNTEVTDKGVEHTLYYANSECWSSHLRNTEVIKVTDTGNGFKFSRKFSKDLDYSDAFYLSILFKLLIFNDHTVEITGDVVPL